MIEQSTIQYGMLWHNITQHNTVQYSIIDKTVIITVYYNLIDDQISTPPLHEYYYTELKC